MSKSRFSSLAFLVLAAALAGCSACQSPFDYCGPVRGLNGCPNCQFGARRNSAFAPMEDSDSTPTLVPHDDDKPMKVIELSKAPTDQVEELQAPSSRVR